MIAWRIGGDNREEVHAELADPAGYEERHGGKATKTALSVYIFLDSIKAQESGSRLAPKPANGIGKNTFNWHLPDELL